MVWELKNGSQGSFGEWQGLALVFFGEVKCMQGMWKAYENPHRPLHSLEEREMSCCCRLGGTDEDEVVVDRKLPSMLIWRARGVMGTWLWIQNGWEATATDS